MSKETSEEIPKYEFVNNITNVNNLAKQGYRLHSVYMRTDRDGSQWPIYVMSYSASKYEGITRLEDALPSEVDGMLADGWEILETYSKFIRMVLRNGETET